MSKDAFRKFLIDQLRDMFSAENQLVVAIPKMIDEAQTPELKDALTHHLEETKNQVTRLNKIFNKMSESPEGEKCEAMAGLIQEASEITQYQPSALRDAALITVAQRIEHYEMAVYGSARAFAKQLSLSEVADLLQESLNEEGKANKKLTEIAEGGFFTSGVNQRAFEEASK